MEGFYLVAVELLWSLVSGCAATAHQGPATLGTSLSLRSGLTPSFDVVGQSQLTYFFHENSLPLSNKQNLYPCDLSQDCGNSPFHFCCPRQGLEIRLFIPNTRILWFLQACLPPLDRHSPHLHRCLLVCLNHPTYGLPAGNLETFVPSRMSAGQPCIKASFAIWKSLAASLISLAQLQLLGEGEAHLFSLRKIFSMQVSVLELLWNVEMVHGARGIRLQCDHG